MTSVLLENAGGSGGAGTAPPAFLIVLSHGYGGNASQLADLATAGKSIFPRAAFMLAEAPEPCPPTLAKLFSVERRRQWFPLNADPRTQTEAARQAAIGLNRDVDAELARLGLPNHAVWFVGFSQGAMVSLLGGLMRPVAPLGIAGIAGALLPPEGDFVPVCRPPVFLVHGSADSVVPASCSEDAALRLRAAGIDVRLEILPGLEHVMLAEAAPRVAAFMTEIMQ